MKACVLAGSVGILALMSLACSAQTIEAVTEDTSYSYLENGKVVGSASKVVETMLQTAGLNDYRLSLYPWARAYDMALLQPNVLIYPILRTPVREGQFKWIGELAQVIPAFYKLRDNHSVVVGQLQDAQQYRVGVLRDDSRQQYLEDKGFTRLVISANNDENLRRLLNGQVDLVPMPEREARQQCEDAGVSFALLEKVYTLNELSSRLYLAYSLATPDDTVNRSRVAFEQLKAEGKLKDLAPKGN